MDREFKEEVTELADAAKKVGKSVTKQVTEKGKEVANRVKEGATDLKGRVADIFTNTSVHTCIQLGALELDVEKIVEQVKEDYRRNDDAKEVKDLNLYIKPEDNAVYYVINGVAAGKVDLE